MSPQNASSDAVAILHKKFFDGNRHMQALLREARENSSVAEEVYNLRKQANLTQAKLASLVGTTTSVISRLEDADYEGHTVRMLDRIAKAVGKRASVVFLDLDNANAPTRVLSQRLIPPTVVHNTISLIVPLASRRQRSVDKSASILSFTYAPMPSKRSVGHRLARVRKENPSQTQSVSF